MKHNTEYHRQSPVLSRRRFIGALTKSAGVTAAATVFSPSFLNAQPYPYTLWEIEAVLSQETFGDGSTIPFGRFRALPGYARRGELAFIEGMEGDRHVIVLHNKLPAALRLEIPGVAAGPLVKPGDSGHLAFDMPPAGTYLLRERRLGAASGPLGFGALIASRPSSGLKELWNGGPAFDREYILLYHDTDSRWNQAAAGKKMPNLGLFEPNYYTVNGLSYPDLGSHPDTVVKCRVGEDVLLRFGNIGKVRQVIHFHGYHARIAARDNVPETVLPMKDTIEVASDRTVDVILPVTQAGIFPLHPHFVPAVTANGLYPYGQLALIEAV